MGETKIIYHLDGQETPYLVKLPLPAERVTLADFKGVLQRPSYKFFFKSMDDDFGWCRLRAHTQSQLPSVLTTHRNCHRPWSAQEALGTPGPHPSTLMLVGAARRTWTMTQRLTPWCLPSESGHDGGMAQSTLPPSPAATRLNGTAKGERRREPGGYDSSSTLMSSELETTSFFDSDEDDSTSRFSSSTEQSSASRLMRRHKRRRRKQKVSRIERSSSFSSITDSTMSLNIITVTLNMEKYNFLGISIVGQSNERGDGGIYIGSIMKGGAVAADGRIEPGDMLLQVNEINFENMSNDDAVRVLREIVHKPGPITLTVAKCWDPSPRGCFTLPRSEPIRPIDPAAWVSHTAAMTGTFPAYGMSPSLSTITSTSSSITSSIPDTERLDDFHLSIHSDMAAIVKAMASPESGLEVRDRMWLKITIPNAFIGSDVVDWLYHNVEGFTDRREARKYASNLLKAGFIRHTVNKITFSEQCYYIFGDLCGNMANLSLHDHDGSSGASDQDTLAPLPHPGAAPWPMAFPYQYPPPPHPYNPHPGFPELGYSYGGGSASSQHSEGSRSSGSNRSGSDRRKEKDPKTGDSKSGGSGSESDHTTRSSLRGARERAPSERSGPAASEHSHRSHHSLASSLRSHHTHPSYGPPGVPPLYGPPMLMMPPPPAAMGPPGAPPGRDLASVPPELTASRQSFRMAMGNPTKNFGLFDFL
ncbi:segment polarity protein dishevelled homolog DVL-3 isoform X3 [Balaenoptera musculus]|uniref:Segment polarity protein dishevelled homolog DVL-3 isoform X3 n=1 Tax=Balaenoptera musculus TaxID=9771 RepID=A0A8B8XB67_BALMU|nr:segment polarity protein dishevelled homolog DVL-3 isoform X3 [Balaenoptera musculus]